MGARGLQFAKQPGPGLLDQRKKRPSDKTSLKKSFVATYVSQYYGVQIYLQGKSGHYSYYFMNMTNKLSFMSAMAVMNRTILTILSACCVS